MEEKQEVINDIVIDGEGKNNKGTTIFLVFVLLIIIVVGVFVIDKFNNKEDKEETVSNNANMTLAKNLYLDDVVAATKDHFYKNKLVDISNLDYWTIQNTEVYGYYKDKLGIVYYLVEGEYKCKDDSSSCITFEQVGDVKDNKQYGFKIYVGINVETEPYTFDSVQSTLTTDNFVEDKASIEKINEELKTNIINTYKLKMTESNLYFESDISNLVMNIQYETTMDGEDYYHLYGQYKCVDGTSDCIYQSQVSDPINGYYPLSLYVVGKTNGNDFSYVRVDDILFVDVEVVLSNNQIFDLQKAYYKEKGFATEASIADWSLVSVTEKDTNKYEVVSRFKCTSSDSSCVYDEQLNDPVDGYYTISVILNLSENNGTYTVLSIE
ncbi:MAG: hypothetical protein IJZ46_06320 [Bacilli bacterium]|nr:hypothetical protein [Bacilli bacterium]